MSDPTVNIFDALRRMGAKLPFRFPMVDTLVPVVQMYDVSRLVSAPVEARAIAGATGGSIIINNAFVLELHSLAVGGLFVEFLALDTDQLLPNAWTLSIGPTGAAVPVSFPKTDLGGVPTRSEFYWTEHLASAALASHAQLPLRVVFSAQPRYYVPPGQRLIIQSHLISGASVFGATIAWSELPASFEPE